VEDRSRRRARLVLIVGLLFAVIAGTATFFYASATKSEAPAPIPTTQVVVAAREIPPKTQVTTSDIKLVRMNTDAVPPGAQSTPDAVVGRIALVAISTGEPILPTKLAGPNGAAFVVIPPTALAPDGSIQPGTPMYRAMSITVGDNLAAGGAIQPGDIVDLLYTFTFSPEKFFTNPNPQQFASDATARIVLERIPILARNVSVYTIRTDATTAERIGYLMASGGQMQMLLRAAKDDRASGTTGATFGSVQPVYKFETPKKISPQ
jgi:Flp pilus assembly protein CpaB